MSKVLERCVYTNFYYHILHLITPYQHGFLRNRSCVTQLLSVLHTIGKNLDKNTQTDIVYLDFEKAFDSVDHSILLQKLKCYGVTGNILGWFADYLNNRRQRVVVDGVASRWAPVTSGATQVWSSNPHSQLNRRIERVQRRATKWILRIKTGEIPYEQRLMTLKLLPLTYDREIKDLVFFYKTCMATSTLKWTVMFHSLNIDALDSVKLLVLCFKHPCVEQRPFNRHTSTG